MNSNNNSNSNSNSNSSNNSSHKIVLSDKQLEFLIKCIDISQSTQSLKPDLSEMEIIRKLSELNEEIQYDKYGLEG